jgi:uncharacterized membrane protein
MKTCKSCNSKNECAQYFVEGATEYCNKYVALQIKPMSWFAIFFYLGLSVVLLSPLFTSLVVYTNKIQLSGNICIILIAILMLLFGINAKLGSIIEHINDKEK